eukprot:Phypoly_transcript_13227.p1 GENE.Phypoly_transcript_13227~~Phypoly_transcript_13227.p1  ORF type:complete len:254 (+),score=3.62 Phypoly_transcript_13227:150-911(+)
MDWRIWIPVVGCMVHVITLLVCYGLTYKHGSRGWVLSLSTIGEYDPERTIFTIGTTIAGIAYLLATLMRHHLLGRTMGFLERENLILFKNARKMKVLSLVSSGLGCLGSVLMCLVGFRPYTEHENLFILSPYIFFVTCMWINTFISYLMKRRRTFFYFFVLSVCGLSSLILAVFFGLVEDRFMQAISSAASYVMIVAFTRFISLYFHDFKNSNFMLLDRLVTSIPPLFSSLHTLPSSYDHSSFFPYPLFICSV